MAGISKFIWGADFEPPAQSIFRSQPFLVSFLSQSDLSSSVSFPVRPLLVSSLSCEIFPGNFSLSQPLLRPLSHETSPRQFRFL